MKIRRFVIPMTALMLSASVASANSIDESKVKLTGDGVLKIYGALDAAYGNVLVNMTINTEEGEALIFKQTTSDAKGAYSFSVNLEELLKTGGSFVVKTVAEIEEADTYAFEYYKKSQLTWVVEQIIKKQANETNVEDIIKDIKKILSDNADMLAFANSSLDNILENHTEQAAKILYYEKSLSADNLISVLNKTAAIIEIQNSQSAASIKGLIEKYSSDIMMENVDGYGRDVLKSIDRGKTWQKTGLNKYFNGNSGTARRYGECIAVDPNNGNVIYCGTRYNGLYRSDDAAENWYAETDIPVLTTVPGASDTNTYCGIRCVVFDDASEVVNEKTSVVYVGVDGAGVYKTTDGGESWSLIDGSPLRQRRMACVGGTLYIASSVGVFSYDGEVLSDITPDNCLSTDIQTVAAADISGERVIIISEKNPSDANANGDYNKCQAHIKIGSNDWRVLFTDIQGDLLETDPYMQWATEGGELACIAINPYPDTEGSIEMWGVDGIGVWKSSDLRQDEIKLTAAGKGVEETCVNAVASVPGNGVFVGIYDYGAFRSTDINSFDIQYFSRIPTALDDHGEYVGRGTSVDFCEANPDYIVLLGDLVNDGAVFFSEDGGDNFKNNGWQSREGLGMGDCAVGSALNDKGYPSVLVCARNAGEDTVYMMNSQDFGRTWHKSEGLPTNLLNVSRYNISINCVEPDRVLGNKFYVYDWKNGDLYYSEDYGVNFAKSKAQLPALSDTSNVAVISNPKKANEIYILTGGSDIYKSTDGGITVTKLNGFSNVTGFSFGKGVTDDIMAMYLLGEINGERGLYRSDNDGQDWIKMNNENHSIAWETCIAGDREVFGRVYVGTSGRGTLVCDEENISVYLANSEFTNGSGTVNADIHANINDNCVLIAALYNGDKLTKVYSSPVTTVIKDALIKAQFEADENDSILKCYLWKNETMIPITLPTSYEK